MGVWWAYGSVVSNAQPAEGGCVQSVVGPASRVRAQRSAGRWRGPTRELNTCNKHSNRAKSQHWVYTSLGRSATYPTPPDCGGGSSDRRAPVLRMMRDEHVCLAA